jgi:hypothetical protein
MRNWWELGEHVGVDGHVLATHRITCPFCLQDGNFGTAHHMEKRGPTGKVLNYDILQCGNCGNLTMAFWSVAHDRGPVGGIHDMRIVPWPLQTTRYPDCWPEDVGRNWLQARRNLEGRNWDAAALMARSAVQLIMRYLSAKKGNLKDEIDDLTHPEVA